MSGYIAWYWLFVPGMMMILNRDWRGEGDTPFGRWFWYVFQFMVMFLITRSVVVSSGWLVFSLGYSLLGWQALFSAIHGRPPQRKDSVLYDWMQSVTFKWLGMQRPKYIKARLPNGKTEYLLDPAWINAYTLREWRKFGAWYGVLRGAMMLPAIIFFVGVFQSLIPLVGLVFLSIGWMYRWAGLIRTNYTLPEGMAVVFAEGIVGWSMGTYLLIIASLTTVYVGVYI